MADRYLRPGESALAPADGTPVSGEGLEKQADEFFDVDQELSSGLMDSTERDMRRQLKFKGGFYRMTMVLSLMLVQYLKIQRARLILSRLVIHYLATRGIWLARSDLDEGAVLRLSFLVVAANL
jgi:hypothetical protein